MPHLALGIVVMLAGAAVMAYGLYVRATRLGVVRGRSLTIMAETVFLFLLGLCIAVAGIIVSLEPNKIQ